jgi:O-antigen ligase
MSIKTPTLLEQFTWVVIITTACFLEGVFKGACIPTAAISLLLLSLWAVKDKVAPPKRNESSEAIRHWVEKIPLDICVIIATVATTLCFGGSTSVRGEMPVALIVLLLITLTIVTKSDTTILEKNHTITLLFFYLLLVCLGDTITTTDPHTDKNFLYTAALTGTFLIFAANNTGTFAISTYTVAFITIISAILLKAGAPVEFIFLNHKNTVAMVGGIVLSILMTQKGTLAFTIRLILTGALLINPSGMGRVTTIILWMIWGTITLWETRNTWARTVVACGVAITGLIAATHLNKVLGLIGKNSTLTGRTQIWEIIPAWVRQKPLLGWGSDFWQNYGSVTTRNEMQFGAGSGHNAIAHLLPSHGLLTTLLFLGVIGYAIYASPLSWKNRVMLLTGLVATHTTEAFGFVYGGGGIVGIWIIATMLPPLVQTTKEEEMHGTTENVHLDSTEK